VSFSFNQNFSAGAICAIALSVSPANAQQRSADTCYDEQDQACLEEMFSDIVGNPSPEKTRAIYLLGLLQRNAGDFKSAKDTFMMSVGFGGSVEGQQALIELFESEPSAFNEPADCLAVESEACMVTIIENGQGDDVRNAQYLLGSMLLSSEPARGVQLLETAHAAGHGTAACVLQDLYLAGAPGVQADYHKSVSIGFECLFEKPFPNLNDTHFAKYEALSDHKAYALADDGFSSYSEGIVDPDVAARLAKEYCDASPQRQSDAPACRVINQDGIWVDSPELQNIPEFSGGFDGLITVTAQASYQDKYTDEEGIKVFVQSKNGSWTWRSSTRSDATIEALTEDALESCADGWRNMLDYPCEVVNINGEWVN
jgi:hypothetical protein